MSFGAIIPVIGQIIDKLFPDPAQADAAKLELVKMQIADSQFSANLADKAAERANDLAKSQLEINKVEAANPSLFVSGGRPMAIWICNAGIAWQFVVVPMLSFILPLAGYILPPLPEMNVDLLMGMLGILLGLGSFRTYEKIKGVNRN